MVFTEKYTHGFVVVCFIMALLSVLQASIDKAARRHTTKSREISKLRDRMLKWSYHSEIWQAFQQRFRAIGKV